MRTRFGYLSAGTLAAVLLLAASTASAAQSNFAGLNRKVNTGDIVCEGTTSAFQNLALLHAEDGGTIYLSFLILPGYNSGFSFFGLELFGDAPGVLFIGKPGAGSSDQYVLENAGGGGQVSSGVAAVQGETVFIVVKAELQSGNDTFTMYVNPGKSEPSSGAVKTDLDIGSPVSIALFSAGAFCVDQIRIGTTYKDVAP